MYCTEPPTDKTIREWHTKFQQSGCLCAAKRRGRPASSYIFALFPVFFSAGLAVVLIRLEVSYSGNVQRRIS